MSSRPEYDELFDQILAGADFRLEREDRTLIDFDTMEDRTILGMRLWVRQSNGRWKKSQLNLTPNTTKDPDSVASILRSYAAILDRRQEEAA